MLLNRKFIFFLLASLLLAGCCNETKLSKAFQSLYSNNAKDRNEAALVMAQCGSPKADRAVPRLIAMLYDSNIGVQSSAAYALRRIDTKAARAALDRASKK